MSKAVAAAKICNSVNSKPTEMRLCRKLRNAKVLTCCEYEPLWCYSQIAVTPLFTAKTCTQNLNAFSTHRDMPIAKIDTRNI